LCEMPYLTGCASHQDMIYYTVPTSHILAWKAKHLYCGPMVSTV